MKDAFSKSVTMWIEGVKTGKDDAAQALWNRYFDELILVARRKLGSAARRVADEEDVAISALQALFAGAAQGRFERLENRTDLWSLLVAITAHKAVSQIRQQTRQKRGGCDVRGNSIFMTGLDPASQGFEAVVGQQPTPEFLALVDEQYESLFRALRDDVQREVARLRLAGFTNEEIAERTGLSLRSVERKIQVVREVWGQRLQE